MEIKYEISTLKERNPNFLSFSFIFSPLETHFQKELTLKVCFSVSYFRLILVTSSFVKKQGYDGNEAQNKSKWRKCITIQAKRRQHKGEFNVQQINGKLFLVETERVLLHWWFSLCIKVFSYYSFWSVYAYNTRG